ncbi:MCE family protein [Aldersonia kunmingensis]|uniref:MCE family protein n=1 Tax=Aldersonia kunmingensis TaxID=408066 RepID=UPI00082FBF87|nr:MCE family protein [Aldersonia kunmingensis]
MARIPRPNFQGNRYFWIGMAGAAAIVVLLLGSSAVKTAGIGEKTISVEFVQAAGMRAGDKVKVAGIDVGQVKSAKLERDKVVAKLQIDRGLDLGPDAHATIKMSTILGAHYIDLETGDGSGLPDNRIPLSNSSVPYNLADVVQIGTPKFQAIDAEKINESLALLDKQLGDSPAIAAQALDSVGALAQIINNRKDEVDRLLKNMDAVTELLANNRNSILSIMGQGEAIGNRVMEQQALVEQLLNSMATLSRQLQEIGVENNGQFGPMLQTLNTMSEGLEKNRDNLNHLLEIMPVTVRQLNNAFGNGNYGDVGAPWLFPDNWLCFVDVIEGCG